MPDEEEKDEHYPFHMEGIAVVFDKPPSAKESAHETREREAHEFARNQVRINNRTAWFNGLLVLATFCTVAIGIWQGFISQRAANAAKDAVGIAEQARKDAKTSSDASAIQANKVLTSSIENFQRDQRPWVMVKYMQISPIKQDKGGSIAGQVVMTNTGRSPAFDVQVINSGIEYHRGELDINQWVKRHQRSTLLARHTTLAIMAPSDIDTVDYDQTLISQQTLDDIRSKTLWVYTFGDIRYIDTFGYKHFTQYCGIYNPKTLVVNFCPNHIYADRDK